MSENSKLDFDQAQTEAIGVQATAKLIEQTDGEPTAESLGLATELLDALRVEEPGVADMMIEQANQWKQIETAVDEDQLSKLQAASKSIPAREGGVSFLRALTTNIDNKEKIVTDLRSLFEGDSELRAVFDSKPEIGNLWYEHLYTAMKMAAVVATAN